MEQNLLDVIYSEGVAPAQGVRPVLSTVDQLVTNRIPSIYLAAQELDVKVDKVILNGHNSGRFVTQLLREGNVIGELVDQILLQNQTAREDKTPATKAVISVHEVGHALVQILRQGRIPTTLTCVTANRSVLGYSATSAEKKVTLRTAADEQRELEVLFGGLAAEEVVFGRSLVTAGSGDDIMRATRLAGLMVKKRGQGSVRYHADTNVSECDWSIKADDKLLDREVAGLIDSAHSMAVEVLAEHHHVLVGLAHELYTHGTLNENQILSYMTKEFRIDLPKPHVTDFDRILFEQHEAFNLLQQVG